MVLHVTLLCLFVNIRILKMLKEVWIKAMDKEIATIEEIETWKLQDLTPGKVVGLTWTCIT